MATKEYTNGEVTVVWKSDRCIHSENCFKGLPQVFNPGNRPWVNTDAADTNQIVEQVKKCPSGALSYYMNSEGAEPNKGKAEGESFMEVIPNGPLIFHGEVKVNFPEAKTKSDQPITAFCRCGGSNKKPFCDGSHKSNGFSG